MAADGTYSQSLRGVSPNRLVAAPATYPAPTGVVYAAKVSDPWNRVGWPLTSGDDALAWLPSILGCDEDALMDWVMHSVRLSYAAGLTVPDAIAAVRVALTVGEPNRVEDLGALYAAALPGNR